jgi:hypothetical protein
VNRIVAIDRARAEVAATREHCRASYDRGGGIDMLHLLCSCWDFHQWCQQLREAEEKLRLLEMRLPPANDVFGFNYPAATKTGDLLEALKEALPAIDVQRLDPEAVYVWNPKGDTFAEVAHWAQVESAHRSHQLRLPTPGMELPPRFPMPAALERALRVKIERAKKSRKKEAS